MAREGSRLPRAARRALVFLALAGWPAGVADARIVRSLAEIRHAGVVIQKWDTSCGAAALATLLSHDLGDAVDEQTVATAMLRRTDPVRVRFRGGFSLLDMQQFVEQRGYRGDGYGDMTIAHLVNMLPAVVPLQLHGYDHFVVVRRIDGDEVHFADPAYGSRRMQRGRFERAWIQKVAFVVARPPS